MINQSQFSVATNFDPALPGAIAQYGACEVYGKLPSDFIGGGRASYMLSPVSRRALSEHVAEARRNGIAFNYLLNAACTGNREFSSSFQRDFHRLLDWLSEIGVERLTVSIPFLLEMIKARYPHFEVKVGVYAQVNSPTRARFWEDLGADCICIEPLTTNRNFQTLRAIRRSVNCELELLANATCLRECPLSPYHMVGLSHASQSGGNKFMIDYCLLVCSTRKLAEPVNYIFSPWIRPEDLHFYESLGYTRFKILERDAPTQALIERTRAYNDRRYDGNLIDIIQPYGYKHPRSKSQPKRRLLWDLRAFVKPTKANALRLMRWREFARLRGMMYQSTSPPPVFIDNRKLDGFLEGLMQHDCALMDCRDCGYCDSTARRAITIDQEHRARCLELAGDLLRDMCSGALWNLPISNKEDSNWKSS